MGTNIILSILLLISSALNIFAAFFFDFLLRKKYEEIALLKNKLVEKDYSLEDINNLIKKRWFYDNLRNW